MNSTLTLSRLAATASALLLTVGCGSGTTPELGYVEGTITLDDQPLEGAMVMFNPAGKGRPSGAVTDVEGWYELTYSSSAMGALVGEHDVTIRTYQAPDPYAEDPAAKQGVAEKVPAKYNARTELTKTVEPTEQVIDFQLDSEGEIVPPHGSPRIRK